MGTFLGCSLLLLSIVSQPCDPSALGHVHGLVFQTQGKEIMSIQKLTRIDMWFLQQIEELIALENEIERYDLKSLSKDILLEAKQKGYADRQIAHLLRCKESEVYSRRNELGIKRVSN